jgi:hypothetical protein
MERDFAASRLLSGWFFIFHLQLRLCRQGRQLVRDNYLIVQPQRIGESIAARQRSGLV